MEKQELTPGFIGVSYGDTTYNAIIWDTEGDFYFYPISEWQSEHLECFQTLREQWTSKDDLRHHLYDILGDDLSDADVIMFIDGNADYLD